MDMEMRWPPSSYQLSYPIYPASQTTRYRQKAGLSRDPGFQCVSASSCLISTIFAGRSRCDGCHRDLDLGVKREANGM